MKISFTTFQVPTHCIWILLCVFNGIASQKSIINNQFLVMTITICHVHISKHDDKTSNTTNKFSYVIPLKQKHENIESTYTTQLQCNNASSCLTFDHFIFLENHLLYIKSRCVVDFSTYLFYFCFFVFKCARVTNINAIPINDSKSKWNTYEKNRRRKGNKKQMEPVFIISIFKR